jgi:hypothetical protein
MHEQVSSLYIIDEKIKGIEGSIEGGIEGGIEGFWESNRKTSDLLKNSFSWHNS